MQSDASKQHAIDTWPSIVAYKVFPNMLVENYSLPLWMRVDGTFYDDLIIIKIVFLFLIVSAALQCLSCLLFFGSEAETCSMLSF